MKCVKNENGKITRVPDAVANNRVESGKYTYCGKEEYKKAVATKGK